jgi:hypothetical protein
MSGALNRFASAEADIIACLVNRARSRRGLVGSNNTQFMATMSGALIRPAVKGSNNTQLMATMSGALNRPAVKGSNNTQFRLALNRPGQ